MIEPQNQIMQPQIMEQAISSFFRTFELVCNSSAPADAARAFAENFSTQTAKAPRFFRERPSRRASASAAG